MPRLAGYDLDVAERVGQQSRPLDAGQQRDRQIAGIASAELAELRLGPVDDPAENLGSSRAKRPIAPVEFGAEADPSSSVEASMSASPVSVRAAAPSFLATRQGKLTLVFLCAVGFLDFIGAAIVNVALPAIRTDLHFSVQNLQWVLSGYLITYGGFMLLGGRAADLLGRRRVLVAGIVVFGVTSLIGGLATNAGTLVGARLAQGLGAAMMLPAALSILTTTFSTASDRHTALGVWGAMAGLASAVGVFFGGVLTEGPGWRWVLLINIPVCVVVFFAAFRLVDADRHDKAGLAAALINSSTWMGGALGLAIFSAIASARTNRLLATGSAAPEALTSGFRYALIACGIFLAAAALIALRARNTRGELPEGATETLEASAHVDAARTPALEAGDQAER
jgi:Major Facilitator Superfamily